MSDFQTVAGTVQQFPDKDVMNEKEVGDQIVREFTVKSITTGKFVRVSAWPEYPDFEVAKGDFIVAEGPVQVNEVGDRTYYNLTARSLVITPALEKAGIEAPKRAKAAKKPSF
jgi:hypothetical protein